VAEGRRGGDRAPDGPVGTAMAPLVGGGGHTRVFALLNTDVQVRPATLMVSKVTVPGGTAWGPDRPTLSSRSM
jgi:formaldehyde-activating enzyme involved in methanogenesis